MNAWVNYEYFGLVVYGPLRSGKSSYSIQALAEVYGVVNTPGWKKALYLLDWPSWVDWFLENVELDWDAWKRFMVFKPREFVAKVKETNSEQRLLLIWDDAGFWLSHYDYHNPFLKAVAEYMNVLASDWASVIFTTPNPKWLLTHVRNLPGGHTGRVSKATGNPYQRTLRYMKVYEGWMAPDLKKTGVRPIFIDHFDVKLPNDVFQEYDAVRRSYAEEAKKRMWETLEHIEQRYGPKTAERKREEFKKLTGIDL